MKTTYGITKGELAACRKYLNNGDHVCFDRAARWHYVMQQLKQTYGVRRIMNTQRQPLVLQ